jgi:hypothetical protein
MDSFLDRPPVDIFQGKSFTEVVILVLMVTALLGLAGAVGQYNAGPKSE